WGREEDSVSVLWLCLLLLLLPPPTLLPPPPLLPHLRLSPPTLLPPLPLPAPLCPSLPRPPALPISNRQHDAQVPSGGEEDADSGVLVRARPLLTLPFFTPLPPPVNPLPPPLPPPCPSLPCPLPCQSAIDNTTRKFL
ncbi:unnamed protein product, partial [Closterium sp. NIES-53]